MALLDVVSEAHTSFEQAFAQSADIVFCHDSGVAEQALGLLGKTGGLQPRAVQPSLALIGTKDAVSVLVNQWDDALANRIAAMNLFMDRSKARRQAELVAFRKQLGSCKAAD